MKRLLFALLFVVATAAAARAQVLVDIATDVSDPKNFDDSEPSIAVNPLNPQQLAVTAFSQSWWGNGMLAPVWMSTDGGESWMRKDVLPQPDPGSGAVGDQTIVYGADGRLFVATLGTGINPPRCFVFREIAGGFVPGQIFGDDQPMIATDNALGPFLNRRYVAWAAAQPPPKHSVVTRSADDGVSTADVTAGSTIINGATFSNDGARVAVAPNHHAFTIYSAVASVPAVPPFRAVVFRVTRSDDGGVTWNANGANGTAVHAGTVQTWLVSSWGDAKNGGKTARVLGGNSWIAINPANGNIWVAFCAQDNSTFGQIYVSRSTNDGVTWSIPQRVTDGTHHSAFPEIAVAANGTVGVLYVDYDNSGLQTLYRHRFARSFDGGANWSSNVLQSFTTQSTPNAINNFLWGDYNGVVALGHRFFGVFTGKSINRLQTQLDPIFFRVSATAPAADVYVRDWTDTAASADDGSEPSTHADFSSTSDVWNLPFAGPPNFNANDQPVNHPPIKGQSNTMFARLSRNATTTAQTVNVKFFYALANGVFQPAGNAAGTNVTLAIGAKSALAITSWFLPAAAPGQITMAVEISAAADPPMPPAIQPGTPVRYDNNRAQRITSVAAP
jgi:hypothetical protein